MKLASSQLHSHLTKQLAPIYVVSGDDPLLVQESLDLIRNAANKADFSERIRIAVESTVDWAPQFYSSTRSLSLFSAKRLLELDLTHVKLNTASSKTLQDYAKNLPENTLLLIRIHKLDNKAEQSSWYKALDTVGVMIPVWPITMEQLPAWISQRAKKLNLAMTNTAAESLAILVEGNLVAAAQELEKIRLLQITDTIDQSTIETIVTDNAHFDIFTLVDSALLGNNKRCLRILNSLAAENTEPTLILWALTRELRLMADIAKQVRQGTTLSTLFPKFRIWEKRQSSVRAFLQRHPQESCWKLLANAAQIDRMIKGAEYGNVWIALKQFVVTMGQDGSN